VREGAKCKGESKVRDEGARIVAKRMKKRGSDGK